MAEPVSAVSGIGLALTVVAQARSVATSIDNRIENYRKGHGKFQKLRNRVDLLDKHLEKVQELLRKFPEAVPPEISDLFDDILAAVRRTLESTRETMKGLLSKAFEGGSSAMGKVRAQSVRVVRAQKLSSTITAEETSIERASDRLSHLITQLSISLKIQVVVSPKLENLAVLETSEYVFHPRTNAPALSASINLDFDEQDAEGRAATPEGILREFVLLSNESSTVTAATGVMKLAYGIVGMAGVGKTVALMGLAHDKDVRIRFPDGILFMTLGKGATVQTVLRELTKVLIITGSNKIAAVVEGCTALRDAVDYATPWFENRVCLFLVDDVWPTNDCKTGFLLDLRQLLRDSVDSRMAISTRSTTIAQCAGALVQFDARDPLGSASMKMFMAHATSGTSRATSAGLVCTPSSSILKILSICAGLPIALAVTGSAVSFLASTYGDFETACESYAMRLEKKRSYVGDADTIEGKTLNSCIILSLEYLEVKFLKWKAEQSQVTSHSISDLYTGLCVLENQAWASLSVLERLWGLDKDAANDVMNMFCEMSLARLDMRQASSGSSKEAGIILHDLLLDFCQQRAVVAKTSSRWHTQLLNGYLEATSYAAEEPVTELITIFMPRPWWSNEIPEDGYIYSNLSRHLACAGRGLELAALLLNCRWMELRGKFGGILALVSDFEILDSVFLRWERSRE